MTHHKTASSYRDPSNTVPGATDAQMADLETSHRKVAEVTNARGGTAKAHAHGATRQAASNVHGNPYGGKVADRSADSQNATDNASPGWQDRSR
jgi:hypothetical protein